MADVSKVSELAAEPQPFLPARPCERRYDAVWWLATAAGAVLFLTWALFSGWVQPVRATGVEQHRLNLALAPPSSGQPIRQTFRARHDGLAEVEILLAQSAEENGGDGAADGDDTFTMRLLDGSGVEIAGRSWRPSQIRHNQALVLRFPPQRDSAGRDYAVVMEGEGQNPFGAWAYDLDVFEGGAMQLGVQRAGMNGADLRFLTRYQLSPTSGIQRLGQMLRADGQILLLSLLTLPLPGCLLLLTAKKRLPPMDRAAWWSLALALGLSLWPLFWYWLTLAGGRWTATRLAVALVAGWLLALVLFIHRRRGTPAHPLTPLPLPLHASAHHILLFLLLVVALAVRLLAVRDLAFPPWVDSSRHALITTLMVEEGQTPNGYQPYLAVDDFTYHFGFHSLAAGVQMLGNSPLPRTLLVLGQFLNALAALSVYGAAWLVTRRRGASLLAAFLVALPFFFPAYYVTWGRFTQLTGVLLLAPLLALTWLVARGSPFWRRTWWLAGLLAAGLFLIHVRVFLVFVPFAALALVASWARPSRWRATRALFSAALLGLLLVAPRLWQLAVAASGSGYLSSSGESYAAFPLGYVTTGWERWFLALGAVVFIWFVMLALRSAGDLRAAGDAGRAPVRRRRRATALLGVVLVGWPAVLVLLLSGRLPGVPVLWLINLNSTYILFFVPLALLLALGFARGWHWLSRRPLAATLASSLLGAAVAASALFGVRQQVTILNETTILAQPADLAGLAWAAENLPQDALVAVNSWRWLGETWAAGDGGAWLLPLTGRQSTTPPVDYIGDRQLFLEVIAFNEGAAAVEDWSSAEAARWLAQQGVTHIFVGARGGYLDPAELARSEWLEMIYDRDGVFVFEIGD